MDEGLLLPLGDFSNKNSDQVDGNLFRFFFFSLSRCCVSGGREFGVNTSPVLFSFAPVLPYLTLPLVEMSMALAHTALLVHRER